MIDRLVNIIALLIMAMILITLAVNLQEAWDATEPWEQEWVALSTAPPEYEATRIVRAIQNAKEHYDYPAVHKLQAALAANFRPTGVVNRRINNSEMQQTIEHVSVALPFLLLPLFINYIRHGKFRLWNKTA